MGVFNSNDIRAVYNKEWNGDTVYAIGLSLKTVLGADGIAVGRDGRLSSDEIFQILSRGIRDSGCDVYDIGLCDTPAVYHTVVREGLGGGVMITASHNPPEYNGLKIVAEGAVPLGYGTGIEKIEELVLSGRSASFKAEKSGALKALDIRNSYCSWYEPYMQNLGDMKILVDCSHGTAGIFGRDILGRMAENVRFINDVPDGNFPDHGPNPMEKKSLKTLGKELLKSHADVGLCFDGDADRVVFVDEHGRTVGADLIIGLLAESFLRGNKGGTVLYDLRCTNGIPEYIAELGGRPLMCPVGHTSIKKMIRDNGAVFGGELTGHYYYRDFFCSDSAWLTAVMVLKALKESGLKMSEALQPMKRYSSSGELNFRIAEKDALFTRVKNQYGNGRLTEIDGLRVDYDEWWFSLRASTNEPLIRLVVEGKDEQIMNRKRDEVVSFITDKG